MFPDVTFRLEIVPTHLTKHCLESIFYMDYHIDCDCIVKCVETLSRIIVTPGNSFAMAKIQRITHHHLAPFW